MVWSIIESCYNVSNCIGKIVTNFKEKANLFNKYFSCQSNPLPNDSKLPENQTYVTLNKIIIFWYWGEDICKIIKTLDINKAHWHDEVYVRMLKLCDKKDSKTTLYHVQKLWT